MSRVYRGKFCNTTIYDARVTKISPMRRIHSENENYCKATSLSCWLFMKYDMSYKAYRRKSKNRRESLRKEYEEDTGRKIKIRQVKKTSNIHEEDKMTCPISEAYNTSKKNIYIISKGHSLCVYKK